ncbi:MAG: hypothetical protein M1812_007527 [Candelaria pacifica]|nr:MAG: hypothetical protein M1812_007527 [Candelaria pacifica]
MRKLGRAKTSWKYKKAQKAPEKKEARSKELAQQKRQEDDKHLAVLEDAKKIIVKGDPSLPKAVRIKLEDPDSKIVKLRNGTVQETWFTAKAGVLVS